MIRICFVFLLLVLQYTAIAQAPSGYYNTASGLSGYSLKTALSSIITSGHVAQSYASLYTAYRTTDTDAFYEGDSTVLDMYSENPNGVDSYFYTHGSRNCGNYNSENDCYNREHLMPQSVFSSALPMQSDVHFVVPSDGYVNGIRSNLPFGEVGVATFTSLNGSKRGNNVANTFYTNQVFEPIDEYKGDIARCLLYVATRYESVVSSWTYSGVLDGTSSQVYSDWFLNLLLTWNLTDSVSPREIARNNACYVYQGNRNPFIDSMQYVTAIWGMPDTIKPTTPLNLQAYNTTGDSTTLSWNLSYDSEGIKEYHVYKDGFQLSITSADSLLIGGLFPNTNYDFYIKAVDSTGLYSKSSDTVKVFTASAVGINEQIEQLINVYPNPTINIINVTSPFDVNLLLMDARGRVLGTGNNQIDMSILSKGSYFLLIRGHNFSLSKKIVKQ